MDNPSNFPYMVWVWRSEQGGYWKGIVAYHKFKHALEYARAGEFVPWRITHRVRGVVLASSAPR